MSAPETALPQPDTSSGSATVPPPRSWPHPDVFARRHIGPRAGETVEMLKTCGFDSLDALIDEAVPASIRLDRPLDLPAPLSEFDALNKLREMVAENEVLRSCIGMGFSNCITPPVIQRNILESPGWYTQYTPYQAEIAQGRLESLLNFQTLVSDLTALPVANASLLDEATAAAEAMTMSFRIVHRKDPKRNVFFVSENCHPQNIEVLRTRAEPLGIEVVAGDHREYEFTSEVFGALVQYPDTYGNIFAFDDFIAQAHEAGALVTVAADILSLCLLRPPGEFGADIAVGSAQRFGVPLGYGGPHAAFMACRDEHKRLLPGRLVGVSKDSRNRPAFRLSLQTREQHIRRDKATSNICTAQALLANIAAMYAVYHGPEGLRQIAGRVHGLTHALARGLQSLGFGTNEAPVFDTLRVALKNDEASEIITAAQIRGINLRHIDKRTIGISLDETTSAADVEDILQIFGDEAPVPADFDSPAEIPGPHARTSPYLRNEVFHQYHSETEMLRYLKRLESRDLSLTTSMIPLGSCTMKLNAAVEMLPVSWPEIGRLHPFAPVEQADGFLELFRQLEAWLAEITGFDAISLQPNAGSQGEFAGLLAIARFHRSNGEGHRKVCLIPMSAHGTNPASAVMAGMEVVAVACDEAGNIDVEDLKARAGEHADNLAALMVTYPSTHGVFEESIREICSIVHEHGGQVYMDGANMNAQVGLCRPGDFGADVCHLNLHKTFCIPHGGGGPGVGPIGTAAHLAPFLPGHGVIRQAGRDRQGAVASAPWGSASILSISWIYIALMGAGGLTEATRFAILNANYMAKRLQDYYPVLYKGRTGLVAHECIIDLRHFKLVTVEDVAKRLMDYGFHAPTVSWPVAGTMMIEPTESESQAELDRLCDALIQIHGEIQKVESGEMDKQNNPLKNAPHTADMVAADEWDKPYSRREAAFPAERLIEHKFWPAVGRIDNVFGDRNLVCTCDGMEAFQ